jgi:hypothetical protein
MHIALNRKFLILRVLREFSSFIILYLPFVE